MRWIGLLRWAAIITTLASLLLVFAVVMLIQHPQIPDIVKCQRNLYDLHGAVERYRATHDDQYPPSLDILSKEYLKDVSVLVCPLAKVKTGKTTYEYTPPKDPPKVKDVLIRCNRHKVNEKLNPAGVYVTVNGDTHPF